MMVSNELLKRNFLAEDTETWAPAARQLGLCGENEMEFLREQLSNRENSTARRHGWGMLAAYLEAVPDERAGEATFELIISDKRDPETVAIGPWVRQWLAGIVVRGLVGTGTSLGEVRSLPGVSERLNVRLSELEDELEEQQGRGNEKAVNAKKRTIQALKDDTMPLERLRGLAPDPIYDEEWSLGSFLSCSLPDCLERIGIPMMLLIPAITRLSVTKDGQRIGYAIYGSKLVQDAVDSGLIDGAAAASLLGRLADGVPPAPMSNQGTWIQHLIRLRRAIQVTGVEVVWDLADCFSDLAPPSIKSLFAAWSTKPDEAHAMALARACLESFRRESYWREMSHGKRLVLPAFVLIVLDPGKGSTRWRNFSLEHRILIVREAIERWCEDNQIILESLVRLLKMLFQQELKREADKKNGKLVEVCRSQLLTIQPLVAAWNLRGVTNKDLAAIAVQALCRCYDSCLQIGDLGEYRRLLYTMLYAIPEFSLLKGMQRYAQSPEVALHLEKIVAFAKESEDGSDGIDQRYVEFVRAVWSDNKAPDVEGFLSLTDFLCPMIAEDGGGMAVSSAQHGKVRKALKWMVGVRVEWEVEASQPASGKGSPTYQEELRSEIEVRTRINLQELDEALTPVIADRQIIGDASQPEAFLRAMQRAVHSLGVLQSSCRKVLPFVERRLVGVHLKRAIEGLEHRLRQLSRIIEGEREDEARTFVRHAAASGNDRKLIANWMLRRFMLSDLVPRGSVLEKLLDIRFVTLWIFSPYLASAVIVITSQYWFGAACSQWVAGLPFLLIILGNITLILAYGLKKYTEAPGNLSRGHLMMPQMVGALFLGLMGAFQADESWTLAFLGSPITRALNLVVFLTASYYFIRLVMLGNQHPQGHAPAKITLRQRAWSVMALGLWQSFALTSLFSLLMGSVMSSSYRADLGPNELDALSRSLGQIVPHFIKIGSSALLSVYILPWAILTWTVKLFFFSAIFERIMNRYGD